MYIVIVDLEVDDGSAKSVTYLSLADWRAINNIIVYCGSLGVWGLGASPVA